MVNCLCCRDHEQVVSTEQEGKEGVGSSELSPEKAGGWADGKGERHRRLPALIGSYKGRLVGRDSIYLDVIWRYG